MNVDRARFLLITAALSGATAVAVSAGGCSASDTKDTNSSGSLPPADSSADNYVADSYVGDASDAAACLADDGVAPTCEGLTNVNCQVACDHYLTSFTKGVGRAITACVIALPNCEGAETEIANCVQQALAKACPDPTAEGFCTPLVSSCNDAADGGDGGDGDGGVASPLDQTECTDLATGLSTDGRAAFTTCITEGTAGYCKVDPGSCIDQIE